MPPDRKELGPIEQKFLKLINLLPNPLRISLSMVALSSGPLLVACTPPDKDLPLPPISSAVETTPPMSIPETRSIKIEREASAKQKQALMGALREFVNIEYLQRGISIEWSEFDPDLARASALVIAGNQPFLVLNHYQRDSSEQILRSTSILPEQNMGKAQINFDLVPGRPFSGLNFDPTPENLKVLFGSIFQFPELEWEEDSHETISPHIFRDTLRGYRKDTQGRSWYIEAAANKKDATSTFYGVDGLRFVAFTVNYPRIKPIRWAQLPHFSTSGVLDSF